MITINSIKYKSYLEMCNAYNINYKQFIQFKRRNKELGEFGTLSHFIPNLAYNMELGYITTSKAYYPLGKQLIPTKEQVKAQQLKFSLYDYYGIPYGIIDDTEIGEHLTQKDKDYSTARMLIMQGKEIPKDLEYRLMKYKNSK